MSYELPTNLAHKPLLTVAYDKYDGPYAGKTDAYYLSIGRAQWANHYSQEFSAKVFRHSGERWSRQSEELPLHRVIDLTTLIAAALAIEDRKGIQLQKGTFENQSEPLEISPRENLKLPDQTEQRVLERLKAMIRTINQFHPKLISEALKCDEGEQVSAK